MKKRIISMLLVGAMLFTSIPMTATAKTSERKYGDVNGDGKTDVMDFNIVKNVVLNNENNGTIKRNL